MRTPPHDLPAAIALWLAETGCIEEVSFCVIYGSVARGTAREGSDIDTLLVTKDRLSDNRRRALGASYAQLQRRLGYTPDAAYPLELWSVRECVQHLAAAEPDDDTRELAFALTDDRLVVVDSPDAAALTETARRLRDGTPGPYEHEGGDHAE
jgi:predicted nucleotidyltransferase